LRSGNNIWSGYGYQEKRKWYTKNPIKINIPKTRIWMYIYTKDKIPKEAIFSKFGSKPLLSEAIEKDIAEYILTIDKKHSFLKRQK
jgi:hypothetical protein